jgi:hypothetical protein
MSDNEVIEIQKIPPSPSEDIKQEPSQRLNPMDQKESQPSAQNPFLDLCQSL